MSKLQRLALAHAPLPDDTVAAIYDNVLQQTASSIRALCLSHERLRMELEGAEKMAAERLVG